MTPFLLGLIGIALSLPVPALLARARWPYRSPAAGIVMWQSLALAAILATSGAGLATALWLVSEADPPVWRVAAHVAVLLVGVLVWARFWWAVSTVWRRTEARRRRQRHLVDLLAEPDADISARLGPALRVLQHESPVAYCLPDRTESRVVVSSGAIEHLTAAELRAVLEHERAHVSARHDLVLEGFEFLRAAYPRVLRTDAPLEQSRIMVELLADDAARRVAGERALAGAIVALAGSSAPAGALGSGTSATIRMDRLRDPSGGWWAAGLAWAISVVVLVVPTVFLAVPWIAHAVDVLLG
ncbi:M56 family metallopeptidase [Aeromicrobium alkaliterrae]|uniref:M56 family metallopeptidase n=1 Tax=Aeromicrobium alkaliterrae TaxID=302168 RepID=A0ABP4VQW5_9ACTN